MPSKKKDTADQLTLRSMRAAAIDRFGGPEVLSIHNLPVPVPEAGLVPERSTALSTRAWHRWRGYDRGSRLAHPAVPEGDSVYAYSFLNPKGGFYAEYVALSAENVAPIPKSIDLEHAGAIPTTGLTAIQASMTLWASSEASLSLFTGRPAAWEVSLSSLRSCAVRVSSPLRLVRTA